MVAIAERIEIPNSELDAFCRRWKVTRLEAFGSVLRDDFGAGSDLDVLVEFEPAARHSIFDVIRMEEELASLAGRPVDLIERRAIAQSLNYLRRREILGTARVFYDAGSNVPAGHVECSE
jgi:uncharacterized protein